MDASILNGLNEVEERLANLIQQDFFTRPTIEQCKAVNWERVFERVEIIQSVNYERHNRLEQSRNTPPDIVFRGWGRGNTWLNSSDFRVWLKPLVVDTIITKQIKMSQIDNLEFAVDLPPLTTEYGNKLKHCEVLKLYPDRMWWGIVDNPPYTDKKWPSSVSWAACIWETITQKTADALMALWESIPYTLPYVSGFSAEPSKDFIRIFKRKNLQAQLEERQRAWEVERDELQRKHKEKQAKELEAYRQRQVRIKLEKLRKKSLSANCVDIQMLHVAGALKEHATHI